ncbi:MAG: S-methyl-5-thioribose-1-phosphate isomerase [Gammaproteobacteria bacterium]|nr:S-methyl-5-thioribose-1-phosphate isomerase [Gammaproteobacteria bacterium]
MSIPSALLWEGGELRLLDQRQLPHRVEYLRIDGIPSAVDAIATLAVRGAPAIGIAAAYALTVAARRSGDVAQVLKDGGDALIAARPTAVNLRWAVERMRGRGAREGSAAALADEAEAIHREDVAACRGIGEHGRDLIKPGSNLLTHCNAGALAVSELGTATAPMYLSHQAGVRFHVYVDETRPLFQGARLTAWELGAAGIDLTLICDNAAASLMAAGKIDLIIVGTDRVARNGDVVNKIGTLNLAVLANHFGVPFYVACPSSTFDPSTPSGREVIIEERTGDEVRQEHAADAAVFNPAFDVTPAALVTGIVTERGIARAPLERSLHELMEETVT